MLLKVDLLSQNSHVSPEISLCIDPCQISLIKVALNIRLSKSTKMARFDYDGSVLWLAMMNTLGATTLHNDIQPNDTQHNDTQENGYQLPITVLLSVAFLLLC
jgi:hypothetical protein